MECKMHGAVPSTRVRELVELLKGLSGRPAAAFKIHEQALRLTKKGTLPADIKIQRSLLQEQTDPEAPERWKIRHESLPMRGQAADKLPASVRGVTESSCYGGNPVEFWGALGFKMEYQSVHEGALFAVTQGQHELSARLVSIKKMNGPDVASAMPIVQEFWLMEVVVSVNTDTPSQMEGLYSEACKALSDFAFKVKDIVTLQKPPPR